METMMFTMPARPPFRLDLTVWALRRRPDNAVDRWDRAVYSRTLVMDGRPLEVAVTQTAPPDRARLNVTATGAGLGDGAEQHLRATLDHLLGLQVDLAPFYRLAASDVRLAAMAQRFRGLKPPRFPTLFEALVNAIACQQITLTFGIRLLNRLTERYGLALSKEHGQAQAFPRPCDLAEVDPDALRSLGFSHQKGLAIVELAQAITGGRLDLDALVSQDDATVLKRLCQLRGVGRWTAEYALLRGLGRLAVFPGDDVGAQNNLRRWLGLTEPVDYASVRDVLAPWQSYAGLVYLHLLMDRLAAAGHVMA
ncbi:MAG: DNA-3-methyladenine glycosylase 2 [Chloroflexi bacterium]|nr:DNA-3-methyladenine glycosylase 2 [Chloroflexota bacterium]